MLKLNQLRQVVADNARKAFEDALKKVAPAEIFGFCLYSDDSALTIVHTIGILRDDWPTKDDDEFWIPHEWEEFGGLLDSANQALLDPSQAWIREYHSATQPTDAQYDQFRNELFNEIVHALVKLRKEGLFGFGDEQLYLSFSVPDWTEKDVFPWVQELNPTATVNAYLQWMMAQTIPSAPLTLVNPDPGILSIQEKDYLCFASRGRIQQLRDIHSAGIRDFVIHEALVLAAWKGKTEVCSYLLQCGANPSYPGYRGKTALEFALQDGRESVIELLPDGNTGVSAPDLEIRHQLNNEIEHLLQVVIPQLRAQNGA